MANIISVERRLYFFYSLRQHMEAIRDQRGSVLSSRRTHKGLSLHNTMKTSVKCVWRKFHRAVCNRCDRFVHSSMESQRIMSPVGPDVPLGDGSSNTGEMFTGLRFSGPLIYCKVVESRLRCMRYIKNLIQIHLTDV